MADPAVEFHGYAMKSKPGLLTKGKFEPWSYHPRLLGDGDIEIAITHCGICGSDLHYSSGGWGEAHYPVICGHEIVGTVAARGAGVTEFSVGDRVGVGAQCHACMNKLGKHCPGCSSGNENHCEVDRVDTYGGQFKDGEFSQGGYADKVRADKNFAFKIPENISSAEAAPLLCAGSTTYSPLKRNGCGPSKRVGVVGLGGLGHLAVQFAAKLGAKSVTVISHSKNKEGIARQLGATDVIDITNEEEAKKFERSIDIMIVTADAKGMKWEPYLALVAFDGAFISVGMPDDPVSFNLMKLNTARINFQGSLIGSRSEIVEMLEFASKHEVRPMIEVLPMSEVNEGIRKVREGEAKYRVVLQN